MKFRPWRFVPLAALVVVASGCGVGADYYSDRQPPLSLEQYLDGPLIAIGTVQDFRGAVTRRLCVELNGQWQDGVGTLDEQFYFDDGERQQRVWTIKPVTGGYQGSASDIKGSADGEVGGFALNWRYGMDIRVDGSDYAVRFDDWLYQLDDRYLLNRAAISKFGVVVGEVTLMFVRGETRCGDSWHQPPTALVDLN